MKKQIDARKALVGSPRPHYLVGKGVLEEEVDTSSFRGKINFSSEGHPSIQDRGPKRYLEHAHVNAGDVCFGVWNAAHILGDRKGYGLRTIVEGPHVNPGKRPILPDTEYDLIVKVVEEAREVDGKGKPYFLGTIHGEIADEGEVIHELDARYFARK